MAVGGKLELFKLPEILQLVEQLLSWQKGEFKFYSGDEVPFEEGFVPISVDELLYQSAEKAVAARPVAAPRPVPAPRPAAAPRAGAGGLPELPEPPAAPPPV